MALTPSLPYRVVVMGAAGVGKSCIISRFMYESFMDKYKATVEEFHQGEYELNGVRFELEIVDTAGAYHFPAMRRLAISTGNAFVLVYSVNDESSFSEVSRFREEIFQQRGEDGQVPIVIVGNKVDVGTEARTIRREEAETTAVIDWNNGYVEVSAKDDVNIEAIFREILVQAKMVVSTTDSKPILRRHHTAPALHVSAEEKRRYLAKRNSCSIS